jgi:hypothetical protein
MTESTVELVMMLITSLLCLALTRVISIRLNDTTLGSIFASSAIILIAYLLRYEFLYSIIFGVSFIGMTSVTVLQGKYYYLSAPVFIGAYLFFTSHIHNIGGLLGFSAFLTVLVMKYASCFIKKVKKR